MLAAPLYTRVHSRETPVRPARLSDMRPLTGHQTGARWARKILDTSLKFPYLQSELIVGAKAGVLPAMIGARLRNVTPRETEAMTEAWNAYEWELI